jgi:hypothetical protein
MQAMQVMQAMQAVQRAAAGRETYTRPQQLPTARGGNATSFGRFSHILSRGQCEISAGFTEYFELPSSLLIDAPSVAHFA